VEKGVRCRGLSVHEGHIAVICEKVEHWTAYDSRWSVTRGLKGSNDSFMVCPTCPTAGLPFAVTTVRQHEPVYRIRMTTSRVASRHSAIASNHIDSCTRCRTSVRLAQSKSEEVDFTSTRNDGRRICIGVRHECATHARKESLEWKLSFRAAASWRAIQRAVSPAPNTNPHDFPAI